MSLINVPSTPTIPATPKVPATPTVPKPKLPVKTTKINLKSGKGVPGGFKVGTNTTKPSVPKTPSIPKIPSIPTTL